MNTNSNTQHMKKLSSSTIMLVTFVIFIGVALFSLNYWHASKCSSDRSPDEIEELISTLKNRLLESESKILKNEIMMNKLINSMQLNLYKLEQNEYKDISLKSNSEAVEVALLLASHPAPPMPIFPLDSQYYNAENLANKIDDLFNKDNLIQGGEYYQDIIENKNSNKDLPEHHEEETLTDSEAIKLCTDMKIKYNVKVGISWGDLPYDLQQQWLEHSCDYHLSDDNTIITINKNNNNNNKIEDKEEENSLDKF